MDEETRKCPICEEKISYTDFYRTNLQKNIDLSNNGVFFDDRVAIPCCRCLNIIEKIDSSVIIDIIQNPNHKTYHIKIKKEEIFGNIEIVTILKEVVLKNLKKFSILPKNFK